MKYFIIGTAVILLCTYFLVFQHDHNRHEQALFNVKFVSEEAAAAAAQFILPTEYARGEIVFNQSEGIQAAEYVLKNQLKLDHTFEPMQPNYYRNRIEYSIEFFDDSNTTFPYTYEDDLSNVIFVFSSPTVVVKLNAGKPRYSQFTALPDIYRIAAHTWKDR